MLHPRPQSVEEVHAKYGKLIYWRCYRIVRNVSQAEDLAQEVFLKLLTCLHKFDGRSKFSTWLTRVTINVVLMSLRKKKYRSVEGLIGDTPTASGEEMTLDLLPARRQRNLDLEIDMKRMVGKLSPRMRQFIVLRMDGYTHEEIGLAAGVQIGSSKWATNKALRRMRTLLEAERAQP